ncbi:MAG: GNAT family N-acetyltransferase [Saprospiraceae bacterium]|nr:GNAT family N-acetyltransferase [Saprospiraceae bacterium]
MRIDKLSISDNIARKKLLSAKEVEVAYVENIEDFSSLWSQVAPSNNIFFDTGYLKVLESQPPEGVSFGYLLFLKESKLVGCANLQIQYFKAKSNIRYEDAPKQGFFRTLGKFFRNLVASAVEFHILVCGNMCITGEHGFYFRPGEFKPKMELKVLDEGLNFAQEQLRRKGISVAGNLIKEFYDQNHPYSNILCKLGYHEFQVQPNMVLANVDRWETFDDYLANITSKYRTRYKRARKKAKSLSKKEFSLEDLHENIDTLYSLYRNIADNSGFNLVNLNKDYLLEFKTKMPAEFRVFAYYQEDQIVGFYSTIKNHDELEAHFIGFEPLVNRETQIYLNMLYDMLADAIEVNAKQVVYARTAMEIKSSVGAEGIEMHCYLKHANHFTNHLLPSILDLLKPTKDWKPRNPFPTSS